MYTHGLMVTPRVLIVASTDLTPELGETLLWRAGIERVFSPSPAAAKEVIPSLKPRLVVVDAADESATLRFVEELRADLATRHLSIAVLSRSRSLADEETLRNAGANAVLSGRVDPYLWDGRLEQLLEVPRRREARIPLLCEVWSQIGGGNEPRIEGWALNMSVAGVLIETEEPVDLGSKFDLAFTLPGVGDNVRAVGQVVREAGDAGGRYRSGVEFLILRGDARERIQAFIASMEA